MSDLTELFSIDPLSYTRENLTEIVAQLRAKRNQFNLGAAQAGSMKPKTAKQKEVLSIASKLDLSGVDL